MANKKLSQSKTTKSHHLQTDDIAIKKSKEINAQFFLTEYDRMAEFWIHTDRRIETAINFYLTVMAAVFPGVILLYQAIGNIALFISALIPVAGFLIVIGIFLIYRITAADALKAEYMLSINLIRKYFADRDPMIIPYMLHPLAKPSLDAETKFQQLKPYFHGTLVLAINTANGFLVGGIVSAILWLLLKISLSPLIIFFIGLGVSVVVSLLLSWLHEKRTKRFMLANRKVLMQPQN